MMDLNKAIGKIETELKKIIGDKKAIVGLSGGIDSTVIAYLCVRALGRDRVLGLTLPCGDGEDVHTADGENVANELDIECMRINIKPIVGSFPAPDLNCSNSNLVIGNVCARIRMVLLYQFANEYDGMVIGTTNKTEAEIGYITKYGDGAVDVEPIADLYKTEVWEVGRILGVPEQIIKKSPTANLWEAQTDEGEFGMTYAEMDDILVAIEDGSPEMILGVVARFGESKVRSVISRMRASEHKRHMPPSFKLRD